MSFDIDISEEAGIRYLHFGSDWVQGAMRIARPWSLELEYTKEMMLGLLLRPASWPRRVLVIGLGTGSVVKFLYRHRPKARQTVVEIAPPVVYAAHYHFRLPDEDERLRIVIDDGADFLQAPGPEYDLILVDGFDADAKSGRLDSTPFYLAARSRLSRQGLLVTNLLSRRRTFSKSIARLHEAFDGQVLALPPCESGNAIVVAQKEERPPLALATLTARAEALREETGLNLAATLLRLHQTLPEDNPLLRR